MAIISAGCNDFGTSLYHRISSSVIRAPLRDEGVVTERHDRSSIGVTIGRQFLHGDLSLGALHLSAKRHQHGRATDGSIKLLNETFLARHIRLCKHVAHLLFGGYARDILGKWIFVLHRQDGCFRIVFCAGRVDECAAQISNQFPFIELPHTTRIRHVRYVRDFNIIFSAKLFKSLLVFLLHHYCHSFLGFGDGQFRGIETRVFGRHAV